MRLLASVSGVLLSMSAGWAFEEAVDVRAVDVTEFPEVRVALVPPPGDDDADARFRVVEDGVERRVDAVPAMEQLVAAIVIDNGSPVEDGELRARQVAATQLVLGLRDDASPAIVPSASVPPDASAGSSHPVSVVAGLTAQPNPDTGAALAAAVEHVEANDGRRVVVWIGAPTVAVGDDIVAAASAVAASLYVVSPGSEGAGDAVVPGVAETGGRAFVGSDAVDGLLEDLSRQSLLQFTVTGSDGEVDLVVEGGPTVPLTIVEGAVEQPALPSSDDGRDLTPVAIALAFIGVLGLVGVVVVPRLAAAVPAVGRRGVHAVRRTATISQSVAGAAARGGSSFVAASRRGAARSRRAVSAVAGRLGRARRSVRGAVVGRMRRPRPRPVRGTLLRRSRRTASPVLHGPVPVTPAATTVVARSSSPVRLGGRRPQGTTVLVVVIFLAYAALMISIGVGVVWITNAGR